MEKKTITLELDGWEYDAIRRALNAYADKMGALWIKDVEEGDAVAAQMHDREAQVADSARDELVKHAEVFKNDRSTAKPLDASNGYRWNGER